MYCFIETILPLIENNEVDNDKRQISLTTREKDQVVIY